VPTGEYLVRTPAPFSHACLVLGIKNDPPRFSPGCMRLYSLGILHPMAPRFVEMKARRAFRIATLIGLAVWIIALWLQNLRAGFLVVNDTRAHSPTPMLAPPRNILNHFGLGGK
jgi:hypothetical protein